MIVDQALIDECVEDFRKRIKPRYLKRLKVEEGSFVDRPANEYAKVAFFKGGNIMTKDDLWSRILEGAAGMQSSREDWSQHAKDIKSQSQLVDAFLKTPGGRKLYAEYQAAPDVEVKSNIVAPVTKRQTLESYAWDKLDQIAKAAYPDLELAQATAKATKENKEWRAIYSKIEESYPLSDVDWDTGISVSKRDAIGLWRWEIDRISARAGV